MKTMKTLLMVLLGAALVLSMAGAVSAEKEVIGESATTPTGQVNITSTIAESYTVTIPADVTIGYNKDTGDNFTYGGNLSVTNIFINKTKTLNVTVTSQNTWNLTTTDKVALGYQIYLLKNQTTLPTTATQMTKSALTYSPGRTSKIIEIMDFTEIGEESTTQATGKEFYTYIGYELIEKPKAAGKYSDTLTFTVACVESPTPQS